MPTSEQVSLPDHAERRRIRDGAGVAIAAVARHLGVSPAAVHTWEANRDPGSARARGAYAAVLESLSTGGGLPDTPTVAEAAPPATASAPRRTGPRLPEPDRRLEVRKAADVTVHQLAAALRVAPEDVEAWEAGTTNPQGPALSAYAALLRTYATFVEPPPKPTALKAPERRSLADLLVSPDRAATVLGLSPAGVRSTMRKYGATERRGYLPQDVEHVRRERGSAADHGPVSDLDALAAVYEELHDTIATAVCSELPGVENRDAARVATAALEAIGDEFADVPPADASGR